jgi:hypothetical protein
MWVLVQTKKHCVQTLRDVSEARLAPFGSMSTKNLLINSVPVWAQLTMAPTTGQE